MSVFDDPGECATWKQDFKYIFAWSLLILLWIPAFLLAAVSNLDWALKLYGITKLDNWIGWTICILLMIPVLGAIFLLNRKITPASDRFFLRLVRRIGL